MPRAPRIEYENAVYHILARGDRREPIVFDDVDREMFVRTLGQLCVKFRWEVFAWVLMDNHYHLAVRTPEANLVDGMKWFQNSFTRRINVRHQLWGHLFGGRYKAILVEDESSGGGRGWSRYLTSLIDYIHLNPARAGMVDGGEKRLEDYPWSSLTHAYIRAPKSRPPWMVASEGFDLFGDKDTVSGRRKFLQRLNEWAAVENREALGVSEVNESNLQSTLRRGWYWGSETFKEKVLEKFGEKFDDSDDRDIQSSSLLKDHGETKAEKIIQAACRHYKLEEKELMKKVYGDKRRSSVAWRIWKESSVGHQWLAERLRLSSRANASNTVRLFEAIPERELSKEVRTWKKLKNVG